MSYDVGDYNRGGFYAFIFAMVFTFGFFAYLIFFFRGPVNVNQFTPPAGAANQKMAQNGSAASMPADADISKIKDPWDPSPAMIAHGHALFMTNCQFCHGATGLGDGPAGKGLNPHPRNLVKGRWQKGGSQVDLFQVITNGFPGSAMPSFKQLPEADRWALVDFVQSITHNKIDKPDQLKAFLAHRK